MAQYRAIFQNAYFKGLATAAVVTMGLAAGQAQAAEATALEADELSGLTGTVTITGDSESGDGQKWKNITIKASTADLQLNANVVISGGTVDANKINLDTSADADKSLTIKDLTINTAVENGLTISGTNDKGDMTLKADNVKLEAGTLKLALDTANVGKLEAKSITIGKDTLGEGKAVLDLSDKSSVGKKITTTASENTKITLNDGAKVNIASGTTASLYEIFISIDLSHAFYVTQ